MKDIQNRSDIEFLINAFYEKVIKDDVIGYIFTDVVQLNWETHIPVMYDFWETILLDQMKYKGNPMLKHIELNKKEPLQSQHFERWIALWEGTIDHHFVGENADEAKKRANLMGGLMQYKIKQSENDGFIQ
jgi:hemoglobin